jgi:hypothetical protein
MRFFIIILLAGPSGFLRRGVTDRRLGTANVQHVLLAGEASDMVRSPEGCKPLRLMSMLLFLIKEIVEAALASPIAVDENLAAAPPRD